ncbi:hypothetical protein J2Y69_001432 [Microbacterium resistens]|uniref:Uncharacterized protein n=1 Tax=Microbacterium resistens TaxID=156977 RepID=A0ABU1SB43_9MICO|nr:hypothetical protein [Microbacterium resistens]MDR6866833.1 hypothetical protein [Microbacterium resistens]
MTNDDYEIGAEPRREVERRTIIKGAAWSVPIIAAAVAVPAYAASGDKELTFGPVSGCAEVGAQTSLILTLTNPGAGDTAVVSLAGTGYTFADGSTTATVALASGTATVVIKHVSGTGNATLHAVLTGAPTVTADATVRPTCGGGTGTTVRSIGNYDADESVNGNVYVTDDFNLQMNIINASTGALVTSWDLYDSLRGPGAVVNLSATPYDVVASPDGTKVYMSYAGDPSLTGGFGGGVLVLDANTGNVLQRIETGRGYARSGLALTSDGTRLTSFGSTGARVINTSTGAVTQTIGVPAAPHAATASPDGSTLYFPRLVGDDNLVTIEVVNAATGSVERTLTSMSTYVGTFTDSDLAHVEVSPDGRTIYVHSSLARPAGMGIPFAAVDIATDTLVGTYTMPSFGGSVATGAVPAGLGISPDGTRAWVPYSQAFSSPPQLIRIDL